MSMKLISFVQPNFQVGPSSKDIYFLPYTVGKLWAHAVKNKKIKSSFELQQFVWKRIDTYKLAHELAKCDIVSFSYYVWNKNYNNELAKQVKKLNPNCIIIAGGPELPITKSDIFKIYPFIDFIVKKEGEIIFTNLLEEIVDNNFDVDKDYKTKGLLINVKNIAFDTGIGERIHNFAELASPYLSGAFDHLVKQNPEIEWVVTIETNRGCPYKCTFCDWGSLTYSKIKKNDLQTVLDEITWAGVNRCGAIEIADANFGIFLERDHLIADKFIETKQKFGFPYHFSSPFAKNSKNENLLSLIKKLNKEVGLTISTQTLNEKVLSNIERKNLEQHHIEEIFTIASKQGLGLETELILGLPGETLESWKDNIFKMFEMNNHYGITIYQLQLLENAPMNLFQKQEYNMKTTPSYFSSEDTDKIRESIEIVTSTKDLPEKDMISAVEFNWFITLFHNLGFSTWISRVVTKHLGISYKMFYNNLYSWLIKNCEWFRSYRKQFQKVIKIYFSKGIIKYQEFESIFKSKINFPAHQYFYNMTAYIVFAKKQTKIIFSALCEYLEETYELSKNMITQLIEFSETSLIEFDTFIQYPIKKSFDYDFLGFLFDDKPLNNYKSNKFNFVLGPDNYKNITSNFDFIQEIHFKRKTHFGKAVIKHIGDNLND